MQPNGKLVATRKRFDLDFFFVNSQKDGHPGKLHCTLFHQKSNGTVIFIQDFTPFPELKIMELLTFDNFVSATTALSLNHELDDGLKVFPPK